MVNLANHKDLIYGLKGADTIESTQKTSTMQISNALSPPPLMTEK
jgi:hypothetical protein